MQVYPSPGIQLAVILLFLALCLLKVWSTSYFLYSQFLSVVWGLAISAVVHSLGDSLPTQFTTRTAKLAVGCCGLLALLALLAYRAEYNAAPIFRIPRSDCTCLHTALSRTFLCMPLFHFFPRNSHLCMSMLVNAVVARQGSVSQS